MTEVPDYVEPVMGVRRWNVADGELRSTGVPTASPPWTVGRTPRATCVLSWRYEDVSGKAAHELDVPVEDCTCGYHAWVNLETCNQRFPQQLPKVAVFSEERGRIGSVPAYRAENETVAGVVSSWGKIILCEYGFRAEYMKIEALILPENTSVEVFGYAVSIKQAYEALAESYNVELVPEQVVDEFMGERGVVLESDPVPYDDMVMAINLKAAAALGWKLGPPPIPSGTQQGMRVTHMPIPEKPSRWGGGLDVALVVLFGTIVGVAVLDYIVGRYELAAADFVVSVAAGIVAVPKMFRGWVRVFDWLDEKAIQTPSSWWVFYAALAGTWIVVPLVAVPILGIILAAHLLAA